jgi:hypothetical protein
MKMKQLVLNMVCRFISSDSSKALVGENLCVTSRPLFLRDVGKYYWNQKTVLEDYKYIVEPVQGYCQLGDVFSSYEERFEHKMLSKNYTRIFPFFPMPGLDYDDVDPRVWIKFYVKSKGCDNLDFLPLKQACDQGKYRTVIFIIEKQAWKKENWANIIILHDFWFEHRGLWDHIKNQEPPHGYSSAGATVTLKDYGWYSITFV